MKNINFSQIPKGQILLLILVAVSVFGYAQSTQNIKGEKVKEKELYFSLDGKTIEYFTKSDEQPSSEPVKKRQVFSLIRNHVNIYFKWVNPLTNKFVWKDSISIDDNDKTIQDFTKLFLSQFNIASTISSSSVAKNNSSELFTVHNAQALTTGTTQINPPVKGFSDIDLTLLYLQLRANQDDLLEPERIAINTFTTQLENADQNNVNIQNIVVDLFKDLVDIRDAGDVTSVVKQVKTSILEYEKGTFKNNQETIEKISSFVKTFTIHDKLLNSYFKTIISKFLDKQNDILSVNRNLIKKLSPINEILLASISTEPGRFPKYFRIRNVSIEEGKMLETFLVVNEYKFDEKTLEFSKLPENRAEATFIFKGYDPLSFSVSTGIFYGSTKLRGFGYTPDPNGGYTITEDVAEKNATVTALFGNINFGLGSRIFSPLIQIGIDPTKTRPFFLAGGGFSIPIARLAISAGGIWTFNSSLDKLALGGHIKSNTELENDIKRKFELDPKGWYIGLQYNF